MNKALLIGSRNCVPYLSMDAAEKALPGILGCAVDACDETEHGNLNYGKIKDYGMIVFMPASWRETGSAASAQAVFRYVLHGGNLLIAGNGLDMGNAQELKVITACVYQGSSYYTELDLEPAGRMAESCDRITVRTVPHFVKPDVFKQSEVLMTFRYGNAEYPALFAHTWSKGKAACLTVDLTAESISALAPAVKAAADFFESGQVAR
ncbi:MAG: hypothetical protein II795_01315 [Firmicutes bacterium]|nr:hypothetical protein [Bacillota bacterium]